jgi:hypothetical protein
MNNKLLLFFLVLSLSSMSLAADPIPDLNQRVQNLESEVEQLKAQLNQIQQSRWICSAFCFTTSQFYEDTIAALGLDPLEAFNKVKSECKTRYHGDTLYIQGKVLATVMNSCKKI